MHWWSIIGIGIASNLDNLGIGVAYGSRATRIPIGSNLMIAALSMICAYLSMTLGELVSSFIPPHIANDIGGVMIIAIGVWGMKSEIGTKGSRSLLANPSEADVDRNNVISIRESFALGMALALNCIASGFGAGISGISPWAAALSVGFFSIVTIGLGVKVGARIAKTWFGKFSNAIGGMLLIAIGVYELFV
ncbi:manganese efflux pump [Paenibacillus sp. GCM10027628]|uniref:manganese efflux pump n=1 Tax=Paenibacillus sp. GCM10027628 TaxID=3273413 RepID=UPI00363907C7